EILDLLRAVRDDFGRAVVLITHNMGVVADLADRVAVMYQGKVVEQASVSDLFATPREDYTRDLLAAVPRLGQQGPEPAEAATGSAHQPAGDGARQPASGGALVRGSGLQVVYPGRLGRSGFHAVKDADFVIDPGEVVGLVGESGSGKT